MRPTRGTHEEQPVIRWGIAGPGEIASRFAEGMREIDGGEVVAVGSRSLERAQAFATRFDIARSLGSYEALADDPDVDAVYVATPHSRHAADTLLFLSAGKHVLCEKPFALNASQANEIIAAAEANQRFVMEAMWSRFLPAYRVLRDVLLEGRVGEPLLVEASFGWRTPEVVPTHRHFDLAQGGGALLDLGVYTVQPQPVRARSGRNRRRAGPRRRAPASTSTSRPCCSTPAIDSAWSRPRSAHH